MGWDVPGFTLIALRTCLPAYVRGLCWIALELARQRTCFSTEAKLPPGGG